MLLKNSKLIAIIGPTASGKTSLGVELALRFNGEIISADSRQVYKGLDVGSGKVTASEKKGVLHHLIDVADPATDTFTLSEYLETARPVVDNILANKKPPFVVGGTGLFVTALTEGYVVPSVPPQAQLRQELQALDTAQLRQIYKNLDPAGFKKIDVNNPRRLIRAIEVVKTTGQPFLEQNRKEKPDFKTLLLGLDLPWEELKSNIHKRVRVRYPAMLSEVIELNKQGVSWSKLEAFGLEYRWMAKLAQAEVEPDEALNRLEQDIISYAKRQLTWWRNKKVTWVKNINEAQSEVKNFLK